MRALRNQILILHNKCKKDPIKEREVQQRLYELGKMYGENWLSKKIIRLSKRYEVHPLKVLAYLCRTKGTSLIRDYCLFLLLDREKEISQKSPRELLVQRLNDLYRQS